LRTQRLRLGSERTTEGTALYTRSRRASSERDTGLMRAIEEKLRRGGGEGGGEDARAREMWCRRQK
jgi:hypothetical protein